MENILHIVNGDGAGDSLSDSVLTGEILICRELMYDGVRIPGWPDSSALKSRAQFLSHQTAGGMSVGNILKIQKKFYQRLRTATSFKKIVLWFDACLCDQSMLAHILACLGTLGLKGIELICVDSFPGILPFNGLGQLKPSQLASLYSERSPLTKKQFEFAVTAENAFACQDLQRLQELSLLPKAPLPLIPAAAARWLEEQPDPETGLGRLEYLALSAIRNGCHTPGEIFSHVAKEEKSPQFWGDTTLWRKINGLAEREPPLLHIEGPTNRLPQWNSSLPLSSFKITISAS